MNKKFTHSLAKLGITIIIMIIILVIGSTSSSYATSSDDSGYNTLKLVNNLNFKANLNNGLVYLSWSRYVPSGFNYYKVIRSTTNSNPVYPLPEGHWPRHPKRNPHKSKQADNAVTLNENLIPVRCPAYTLKKIL